MRTVTINKVINKKVNDWLKTITDTELRSRLKSKIVVTGGCITSMLLKEDPNDFDIYFKDLKTTADVANYYLNKMGGGGYIQLCDGRGFLESEAEFNDNCDDKHIHIYIRSKGYLSEKGLQTATEAREEDVVTDVEMTPSEVSNSLPETGKRYRPVFITSNAVTLSNKVQLIIRFSGEPEKIHSNFDFTHTKMYWTHEEGVVTNINSLESILSKRLIYSGSKFPLCSVIRTRKFIQRGWTIDAGQFVKMMIQANQIDLLDPKVLIQQLIGVDTTYFTWLLDAVTNPEKLTDDGKIDNMYVMELLNDLFDSEKDV